MGTALRCPVVLKAFLFVIIAIVLVKKCAKKVLYINTPLHGDGFVIAFFTFWFPKFVRTAKPVIFVLITDIVVKDIVIRNWRECCR